LVAITVTLLDTVKQCQIEIFGFWYKPAFEHSLEMFKRHPDSDSQATFAFSKSVERLKDFQFSD